MLYFAENVPEKETTRSILFMKVTTISPCSSKYSTNIFISSYQRGVLCSQFSLRGNNVWCDVLDSNSNLQGNSGPTLTPDLLECDAMSCSMRERIYFNKVCQLLRFSLHLRNLQTTLKQIVYVIALNSSSHRTRVKTDLFVK